MPWSPSAGVCPSLERPGLKEHCSKSKTPGMFCSTAHSLWEGSLVDWWVLCVQRAEKLPFFLFKGVLKATSWRTRCVRNAAAEVINTKDIVLFERRAP